MLGIFYLLLFYLLGNLLSALMNGFVPGSVLGMLLLFAALLAGVVNPAHLRKPARFLLDNMMLFFVPVAVGLMAAYDLIRGHLGAIIVSLLLSTLVVLVVVGIMQQKLGRRRHD
ncbi:MAG: CidA/LrgA family protein [Rikenellaceae bacterium]|nr:CidA/LrgA family protein [Rikenellaceae bacterium]